MEDNNNQNLIQEIDQYIKSLNTVKLNKLLRDNFVSKYLPQDIQYNPYESIGQKTKQFIKVIGNYAEYRKILKTISNSNTTEFLAILVNYDIIKNNIIDSKGENKENLIQTLVKELQLQWVSELDYYSNYYFDSTLSSIKKDENISDILNGVLSKKFAFNLYTNIVKNGNLSISKKMDKIKECSSFMLKRHNFFSYADTYESVSEIIIDFFKENDFNIQSNEDLSNVEERINNFYEIFDFPENLKKLGYTPENITFQVAVNSCIKKSDFIVNVLKLSNRYGDKLRKHKPNAFFDDLFSNMEMSFNHLMENSDEQEIKKFIKLYNDIKYTGKLDYTYVNRIMPRSNGKIMQEIIEENPLMVYMEDRIGKKLIEFSKQNYDETIEFIKNIPQFVCGQNNFSSNYKTRNKILPQILGVNLSDEDITILEGKQTYDEIMMFLLRKKGCSAKGDKKDELDYSPIEHGDK